MEIFKPTCTMIVTLLDAKSPSDELDYQKAINLFNLHWMTILLGGKCMYDPNSTSSRQRIRNPGFVYG